MFHDWKGYFVGEISQQSRNMQWVAAAKDPEVHSDIFPISLTASSTLYGIEGINEINLMDVSEEL